MFRLSNLEQGNLFLNLKKKNKSKKGGIEENNKEFDYIYKFYVFVHLKTPKESREAKHKTEEYICNIYYGWLNDKCSWYMKNT